MGLANGVVFVRFVSHRVRQLNRSAFRANAVNASLPSLYGGHLPYVEFSASSGEPAFTRAVFKFPLHNVINFNALRKDYSQLVSNKNLWYHAF